MFRWFKAREALGCPCDHFRTGRCACQGSTCPCHVP
jgi:hypothetical protein